ncbi:hypothetical protein C8R44DRAFT_872012 [Mycena epipterygia]|nr:hypothetical protein C8R44DRAFT_872012 [Mycena epipterygia]
MRIWFFSRSHEFDTPPFSFLSEQNIDCYLILKTDPVTEECAEAEEWTPPPPFWFNPLHNLESLMWIVLFAISHHRRRTSPAMRHVLDTYFPAQFSD